MCPVQDDVLQYAAESNEARKAERPRVRENTYRMGITVLQLKHCRPDQYMAEEMHSLPARRVTRQLCERSIACQQAPRLGWVWGFFLRVV